MWQEEGQDTYRLFRRVCLESKSESESDSVCWSSLWASQSLSLESRKTFCLLMGCPALALFVPHFEAGALPRLVNVGWGPDRPPGRVLNGLRPILRAVHRGDEEKSRRWFSSLSSLIQRD